MEKPEMLPIDQIDFKTLQSSLQSHMDAIESGDCFEDDDDEHYIYEDVMKTFFGKDVFTYINQNIN